MHSVHNNERSSSIPESIYRALAQLMEEIPYEKITITDICRRAGVSRMAYYRNYSSKQAIFLNALERRLEEIYSRWEKGEIPAPINYWTAYFAAMRQDELVPLILKAKLGHDMDQCLSAHGRKMIAAVDGWDLSEENQRLHFFFSLSGAAGLIDYGLFEDPSISNETLARYMVQKIHA